MSQVLAILCEDALSSEAEVADSISKGQGGIAASGSSAVDAASDGEEAAQAPAGVM